MESSRLRNTPSLASRCRSIQPQTLTDVPPDLDVFNDGHIQVIYAPVDGVNPRAKVLLLGITPGWAQAEIAYRVFREHAAAGHTNAEAFAAVEREAAFAGPMRANLVSMLDDLDLPQLLGIGSCDDLFGPAAALVHTTSALRYPVFVRGKNYSGHPTPEQHSFLREMLDTVLAPELATVGGALIVPLGKAVKSGLNYLSAGGTLDTARCLVGFPHPSGANGHRKRQFASQRRALRAQAAAWFGAHPDR